VGVLSLKYLLIIYQVGIAIAEYDIVKPRINARTMVSPVRIARNHPGRIINIKVME